MVHVLSAYLIIKVMMSLTKFPMPNLCYFALSLSSIFCFQDEESIAGIVDLTLRDQILEMEEKIFFGTLGSLKIRDRAAWQKAIQVSAITSFLP